LATATLAMVVRVPDTPEVTIRPRTVSLPVVAAAAGEAVVAGMANAIPAASSAPVAFDFMTPPRTVGIGSRPRIAAV
jgi:hypothetical protein